MNGFPPCGWRGGGCVYHGPWQFVLEMALVLLALAGLIWFIRNCLDGLTEIEPEEDPSRPVHYRFDDAHMDRIVTDDDQECR